MRSKSYPLRSAHLPLVVASSLFVGSILGAGPGHSDQPCPTSSIALLRSPTWVGNTPTASQTAFDYYLSASGSYDLRVGWAHVDVSAYSREGNGGGSVAARDSFRLLGVPAGTPTVITARIRVEATFYGNGPFWGAASSARAWLSHPASGQSAVWDSVAYGEAFSGGKSFDLDLPLEVTSGEDFLLELGVGGQAGGASAYASSVVRLGFLGLPDGAFLTSCQGYSTATTPVLASVQETRVEDGSVTILWYAPDLSALRPRLARRTEASEWTPSDVLLVADGDWIRAVDASVVGGTRYGYRLEWLASDGTTMTSPEAWVSVPERVLEPRVTVLSNPARGRLELELRLPESGPTGELALLDVSGRVLARLHVAETGSSRITWPGVDGLPSGLYWIRWQSGTSTGSEKVAILR